MKNTDSLQAKMVKLEAIVNANVNLMDDILSHVNSVLTLYVGVLTAILAVVTVVLMTWIAKTKKDEIESAIRDVFRHKKFLEAQKNETAKYFESDDFKEELEKAIKSYDDKIKGKVKKGEK